MAVRSFLRFGLGAVLLLLSGCDAQIRIEPINAASVSKSADSDRTITLVSTQASTTNSNISVTAVFSQPVSHFSKNHITVMNGTADAVTATDSKLYSFLVTPSQEGLVVISIASGVVTDSAGRGFSASNALEFTFDPTLPTLLNLSFPTGALSNSPTPAVQFLLNKPASVSLFRGSCQDEFKISQTEEKLGNGITPETIAVTEAFSTAGTYPIMIQAQVGSETGTCMKVGDYVFDNGRPTVSLTSNAQSLVNSAFQVTATFSEAIAGFGSSDIYVDGGAVLTTPTVVAGTNFKQYRFTVVPSAQGIITVRVADSSVTDAAGNWNTVSSDLNRNHDSVPPTATLSSTAPEYVNSSFTVKAVFSESVSGLTLSDVNVVGGSASAFEALAGTNSTEYQFLVTPNVEGDVSIKILGDGAVDAALNGNTESATLQRIHDTMSPTASVTSSAGQYVNGPFEAKAVFSEPVSSFTSSGIELVNASAGVATGVSETYVAGYGYREYRFTVIPTSEGQISVAIKSNAALDRVGNPNYASDIPLLRNYDVTAPSLIAITSASSLLVNQPFTIELEFSEPMGSVESADLNLTRAQASGATEVPGSNSTRWQFTITPTAQGIVTVELFTNGANDRAGNGLLASGSSLSRTFDNIQPSVSLSSAALPYVSTPFKVTIDFSEPINGFTLSDISVSGAVLLNLETLIADQQYRITVSPTSEGTVSLNIPASAASDPTGNTSLASTTLTRTYDVTRPTVVLSSDASEYVNGSFLITATFSEPVPVFESSDLEISGGMINTPTSKPGTSDTVWEFIFTPNNSGTVSVQVQNNTTNDRAGNPNEASGILLRNYDQTAPIISNIQLTSPASPTTHQAVSLSFEVNEISTLGLFEDALCDFPASELLSNVANAQSLTTSVLGDGSYSIYVKAQDRAGNISCTSALSNHIIDTTVPTGTSVSITNTNPTKSNNLNLQLAATDATAMEVQIALNNFASATCSGSWESFEASKIKAIPEILKNGTVNVDVRFRDAVMNTSSCIRVQIVHDNIPPADPTSLVINEGAAVTNSSLVTVKVTASDNPYELALSQNSTFCSDDSFLANWVSFGGGPTRSLSHSLTSLNANNTIYARTRDQAGNLSGCVSSSIIHSNTAPINPGISIESGAERTNKTQASLTLTMTPSGSNNIEMYVTSTPDCAAGGTWVDYSASLNQTLSPLNQETFVSVKYRDKDAPYFETECVSDSIYHDNIAPLGTGIRINSGETATPNPWLYITLLTSYDENPYYEYQMNVFESATCTGTSLTGGWSYFYEWFEYYVSGAKENTQLTFSVKFRDQTGNETACASATILHDNLEPRIDGIEKPEGPLAGGVPAILSGVNFRSGSENSVYFGSRKATCSLVGSPVEGVYSQLSCTVPAPSPALVAAQTVTVTLTNPSTLSATRSYTYQEAPQILSALTERNTSTGLTRTSEKITLSGAFFRSGITVSMGGLTATNISLQSPNQVSFTTPAFSTVGPQTITVTNTDNQTASFSFTFDERCTEKCGDGSGSCFTQSNAIARSCATLEDGNENTSPLYLDYVTRVPTVYINSNQKGAESSEVTLTLSASYLKATEMYLTNTAGCNAGGSWEPYALSKRWFLTAGSGNKTVYAKFRNSMGTTTSCVSDSISVGSLDTEITSSQFRVWVEKTGEKILTASGLWSDGWQYKLNPSGKGHNDTTGNEYLATQINLSNLANRTNPTHVYLDDANKFLTGKWLYYSTVIEFKTMIDTKNSGGIEANDWLDKWDSAQTTNGADGAWFEGNISHCKNIGMRLPTAYETVMPEPSAEFLPTAVDGTPTFAGANGVPEGSFLWLCTATPDMSSAEADEFLCYRRDSSDGELKSLSIVSSTPSDFRCVLP